MHNVANKLIDFLEDRIPSREQRFWDFAFLSSLSIVAIMLRLRGLGHFGFWWDELYHVIAAKSLLENGDFYIPLIGQYTRALLTTMITSGTFFLFGEHEFAPRIPSVLFNIIFMWISYFLITPYIGRKYSVFFILFLCVNPLSIALSRQVRMYSFFQLLYFSGVAFFYNGISGTGRRVLFSKFEYKYGINISYLTLSAFVFAMSFSLHELTLNFGIALLGYSILMVAISSKGAKIVDAKRLKYLVIILGFFALLCVAYGLFNDTLNHYWEMATTVPPWSSQSLFSGEYYWAMFNNEWAALWYTFPLGICILFLRDRNYAIYVFSNFAFVMGAHMFLFARAQERYVFYIVPFLMIGSSVFWGTVFCWLLTFYRDSCQRVPKILAVFGAIGLTLSFNAVLSPWVDKAIAIPSGNYPYTLKYFPVELVPELGDPEAIIITTRVMSVLYYFERPPDFAIRATNTEYRKERDERTGIRVVRDSRMLENIITENDDKTIVFLFTPYTYRNDAIVSPSMRKFIEDRARYVDLDGYSDAIVFMVKPDG